MNSNVYYPAKEAILLQIETVSFDEKATLLDLAMKTNDVNVRQAVATSGCLCLMPDLPTLRLIKVLPQAVAVPTATGGPIEYTCIPVEGKPDVYDLKADGRNVGRASIQTLSISLALHQKKATGQALKVMAEWNEDFESHVVVSVL